MPNRLTKIYTRKGDTGETHLGEKRLPKDDALVEAVGTVDELNAVLGLLLAHKITHKAIEACLLRIQNELFDLGGELHLPKHKAMTAEKVAYLEEALDSWNDTLPPLKEFVLPGGNLPAATCHLARTVCRRAERTLVHLNRQTPLANPDILRYINRLSDVLFVMSRVLARESHAEERLWER